MRHEACAKAKAATLAQAGFDALSGGLACGRARFGRTPRTKGCEKPAMYEDTHPIPDPSIEREYEMVAAAESNAPPAMLAAQREWDARVERDLR